MTLGELIDFLSQRDPAKKVPIGFGNPHSYRGYYDELAFEPVCNTTVGSMLSAATYALGETYHGWKGGEYTMKGFTECWLAYEGECGEALGLILLRFMLQETEDLINIIEDLR